MRNIFDQYTQPENRVTHALLTCLSNDRSLLRRFLRWTIDRTPELTNVTVVEQGLPGEAPNLSEDEAERRGLPDGCISDGESWALLIESKFAAKPSRDQMHRHLRTARRHGIVDAKLLLITIQPVAGRMPAGVFCKQWSEVYGWLATSARKSFWARHCLEYLEVAEAKEALTDYLREGKLTVFSGIPFADDQPYSYLQAKRLLGVLRDELTSDRRLARVLGADLQGAGRPAITGRDARLVWDFIPLTHSREAKVFTQYPHLTIGIHDDRVSAAVTVPNGIRSVLRSNLLGTSFEDFESLICRVTTDTLASMKRVPGFMPEITVLQRHYLSQRSAGVVDCLLKFDARTALPTGNRGRGQVKRQPQWLRATYDALASRRSNLQLQVGGSFPYQTCPTVRTPAIARAVADVWLAAKPVVRRAV